MSTIQIIRTTAFRLSDEHFGTVYVYRPGDHFIRAWEYLETCWREVGDTRDLYWLPYRSLAVALRVMSGDFVALQRKVKDEQAFILSRRELSLSQIEAAVGAWEVYALGLHNGQISRVVGDLSVERVDVAKLVQRRAGLCPRLTGGNWPWDVAIWEISHRLVLQPMFVDNGQVRFRLDSDAALVSWDQRVTRDDKPDAVAMHKITPHLITVPGVEAPVVSLQASLVRLAPSWRVTGGARNAWAEIDRQTPLLRARVRTKKVDGDFITFWDDRATDVLGGASLHPLPDTRPGPTIAGNLRTGYAKQPRRHAIGRGVGTWFHECVTHHARQALGPTAEPIVLTVTSSQWPTRQKISPRVELFTDDTKIRTAFKILVVYSSSDVRRRIRDALVHVLKEDMATTDAERIESLATQLHQLPDGARISSGGLEVCFIRPPDADLWLLRRASREDTIVWLDSWLSPMVASHGFSAALVETDEWASKGNDDLDDPKHVLRAALAARMIVTQFITRDSAPGVSKPKEEGESDFEDHAAGNAVCDLMRSAGYFLRPFPVLGVERGTLVVGIYGTRLAQRTTGKDRATYLVNLVAVSAGGHDAWGYVPEHGWKPLGDATARFLSSDHENSVTDAKKLVEGAVEQLRLTFPAPRIVLLFDAVGCRRFWECLTDRSDGQPETWMTAGNKAVARIRSTATEVLRPAGAGEWTPAFDPARHTDFRAMVVEGPNGKTPSFVLSGSAVMSRGGNARVSTRFAATGGALGEDWHALCSTEILVLDPGPWTEEVVVQQAAIMCRIAPTWDRGLRWPSPLHLARAIVRDHPHKYFADSDSDAEEIEDAKQLRFDFM